VLTDGNRTKYLRTRADVDVSRNFRGTFTARTKRHLLEQEAIRPNFDIGMNHYSIWVRQQQTAAEFAVQWDVCARDDGPPPMPKNCDPS
jgi:hypothetical protein